MSFDADQTIRQVSESVSATLLLDTSCQALLGVTLAGLGEGSPWSALLAEELAQAQRLAAGWQQGGGHDFQDDVLARLTACAAAFGAAQPSLDAQFAQLQGDFNGASRDAIVAALNALGAPVQALADAVAGQTARLTAFDEALAVPYGRMNTSVAQMTAEERDLEPRIAQQKDQQVRLAQQLQDARSAIADVEAERSKGTIEAILGIALTVVTGPAGLSLGRIGVNTLEEAQAKVASLQSTIKACMQGLVSAQQQVLEDQYRVGAIQGLLLGIGLAQSDIASITTSLEALRTMCNVLLGEIDNAAANVAHAQDAAQAIVAKVWFDAACVGWQAIGAFVASIQAQAKGGADVAARTVPAG